MNISNLLTLRSRKSIHLLPHSIGRRLDWFLFYFIRREAGDWNKSIRIFWTFRDDMHLKCHESGDVWWKQVQFCLKSCTDIFGEEAVYYKSSHASFWSNKDLPSPSEKHRNRGHTKEPVPLTNSVLEDWVVHTKWVVRNCWKQGRGCFLSKIKWLKQMHQELYNDYIYFAEESGRKNIVCNNRSFLLCK